MPGPGFAGTSEPAAVLLLPRRLEGFIQHDQVLDLLRSPGVVAVEAPVVPYGVTGRLPAAAARRTARAVAARLRLPSRPRAIVMFHPLQLPVARALLDLHPGCELWYCQWDRYDHAYDASPRLRERLARLHAEAAAEATACFAVSEALVALEREAGREAALWPSAADTFPAPDPEEVVVAVSLGHLGWRVDWKLLREVARGMPELVVLLIGRVAEDQVADDPDYAACRTLPNLTWLGWRSDDEAARLMLCADMAILPFKVEPFNDAGLPNRVLKAARLGLPTLTPELEGVRTWSEAVVRAPGAREWIATLRERRGARARPDAGLRSWALEQTARRSNAPLWDQLSRLGVAPPPD